MQIAYHPYILLPLVALGIALVLVARVWRYRTRPIAKTFLVLMLALAEWSLAAVMEHASPELPAKVFWMKMAWLGITTIPVAWLAFTLQYTGREKWLTRRNIAILTILPVVTLVMVWTNNLHHLMWKDIWLDTSLSLLVVAVTHNTWFWVYAIYAYSLLLLGVVCLFSTFLRSSGIYRKQVGAMLFAALVPWAANFLFIAGIEPFSVVDPTPLAFAITGVAFYWGLTRFQLLDIVPMAHKAIFTSIVDGVIVLDTQHRIIELNPAAGHIFGRTSTDAIGQPLSRVLPEQAGLAELQPEMTEIETEIVLGEGKTQHYYRVHISPIHAQKRFTGHVILLHDETERRKAEIEANERVKLEAELTERKRSEAALRQSEENLRSYLESAPDGVYLNDLKGTFLYGNKKAEELTGYTREELVGKTFLKLKLLVAKDIPKAAKLLALNALGRPTGPDEFELAGKDGRRIQVEINTTPIKQERKVVVIGFVRDITERKKAEHNIGERVKELACLYGVSQIVAKSDASLDEILEKAIGLIPGGWQYPEITCARVIIGGKEFKTDNFAVTEWKQSSDINAGDEKIGTLDVYYLEKKAQSEEGLFLKEERHLMDSLARMLGEVTQLKQAEAELTRLYEETQSLNLQLEARVKERTRQLEEAVTAAMAASQAKSEFLASMSHELRTPLNAIIGFSQVLREQYFGNLNEKQAEYVSDIVDSGKHLLELINDVLDLSKVEAGKVELEISRVKIAELLQNSLVMIKEKALACSISLEVQTAKDIEGLEIMADERRLKQVMFNLLSNAVKFTPDSGAIKVEGRKEEKELIISVSDTGIGITPQEQKKVFEEFYQASSGVKDKTPGTGLGLALTKTIVEMHGGRVWVESEGPGKGSRFTFTLPI